MFTLHRRPGKCVGPDVRSIFTGLGATGGKGLDGGRGFSWGGKRNTTQDLRKPSKQTRSNRWSCRHNGKYSQILHAAYVSADAGTRRKWPHSLNTVMQPVHSVLLVLKCSRLNNRETLIWLPFGAVMAGLQFESSWVAAKDLKRQQSYLDCGLSENSGSHTLSAAPKDLWSCSAGLQRRSRRPAGEHGFAGLGRRRLHKHRRADVRGAESGAVSCAAWLKQRVGFP